MLCPTASAETTGWRIETSRENPLSILSTSSCFLYPPVYLADIPTTPLTQIDVMVLYSVSALTTLGGITPQQMETVILESLVGTNQAMVNSGVSAYMNPVHVGLVRLRVCCTALLGHCKALVYFRPRFVDSLHGRNKTYWTLKCLWLDWWIPQ